MRNLGSADVSITATPVSGNAETYTIEAGAIQELALEGEKGKAVSTVYSSIAYQYEGGTEKTYNVSQVIPTDANVNEMRLDVTNHEIEEGKFAITVENNGAVDGTLSYQVTGESATTQDIVAGGAFTLPANVTSGNTIGDVYTTLYFTPEGGDAVLFDTTTTVTSDITLNVVGGGL